MKVFTVVDDTFKVEPLFVMDCTYETMQAYLLKRFKVEVQNVDGCMAGVMLTFSKQPPWRVVWLRRSRDSNALVHELFHLVTRICQDKGIPIVAHHATGENGDETAAYMLEHFYESAMRKIRK